MRIPFIAGPFVMLALAGSVQAQTPSFDIQAKRPLPTGKYAVDLTPESELGRDIRRMVMEKLAARGYQVGFSGGHVMKLQVDITRNFTGGYTPEGVLAAPRNQVPTMTERGDARPPMPERRLRDLEVRPRGEPEMLRINLTLQAAGKGEVIWIAYAACPFNNGRSLSAGRAIVDAVFANPNKSRRGEPDCPL